MTEKDYDKGFTCSHCGSYVQQYRRKLNSSMARVLIAMYKANKKGFFHVENWLKEIGKPELRADFHKLRFWNLIEAKSGEREDGSSRNGYYKLTGRGVAFALDRLTVPQTVILLHNKFQGFEGAEIGVQVALGTKFNYSELMGLNDKTEKGADKMKQLSLL